MNRSSQSCRGRVIEGGSPSRGMILSFASNDADVCPDADRPAAVAGAILSCCEALSLPECRNRCREQSLSEWHRRIVII